MFSVLVPIDIHILSAVSLKVDFRIEQVTKNIYTKMSMLLHYNVTAKETDLHRPLWYPDKAVSPHRMRNFSCTGKFYKNGTATNTVVLTMKTYGEK